MSTRLRILVTATLMTLLSTPAFADDVVIQLSPGDDFVIQDDGSSELWSVDEATGEVSRNGDLFLNSRGIGSENLFLGRLAGSSGTTGTWNSAFGSSALTANTSGYRNSAFGSSALLANVSGDWNSAFGHSALSANVSGGANSAFGGSALRDNVSGSENAAFGYGSLEANTEDSNSAFGYTALNDNTTGFFNSAFGRWSTRSNISGHRNAAFGANSLTDNTSGARNVAIGESALSSNVIGNNNAGIGASALLSATGNKNIGIGYFAGYLQTTGSDNIYIANYGVAAESNKIRIGTQGTQDQAFMAGIWGNEVGASTEVVRVNSNGELGVGEVSSLRFKEAVRDMGDDSAALMKLRLVTFRYKDAGPNAADSYGLIAEEVAETAPALVIYDEERRPHAVRYELLGRMLLNEVQKQQTTIEGQAAVIDEQQVALAALAIRLEMLESRLGTEREASNR